MVINLRRLASIYIVGANDQPTHLFWILYGLFCIPNWFPTDSHMSYILLISVHEMSLDFPNYLSSSIYNSTTPQSNIPYITLPLYHINIIIINLSLYLTPTYSLSSFINNHNAFLLYPIDLSILILYYLLNIIIIV